LPNHSFIKKMQFFSFVEPSCGSIPIKRTPATGGGNPWGVAESTTSPFWVSDQGTNDATIYSVTSAGVAKAPLTVSIPTTAAGPQGPTGQVFNATQSFDLANGNPAHFIFANLNGTISAWNGGASATVETTPTGGVYPHAS
jgi:hypothetical protein